MYWFICTYVTAVINTRLHIVHMREWSAQTCWVHLICKQSGILCIDFVLFFLFNACAPVTLGNDPRERPSVRIC